MLAIVPVAEPSGVVLHDANGPKRAYIEDRKSAAMNHAQREEFDRMFADFRRQTLWVKTWYEPENRRTVVEWQELPEEGP